MDYPLEELGPERFQQLCQALLLKEFPRVQCFPVAQPDGGRDGISYLPSGSTNKFIVFQVKYARKPLAETQPHKWLAAIIQEEAPKIRKLIPRGASQFLLITNIPGTSHLDTGSIDLMNETLERELGVPSKCWWRDDLDRRLDSAWDLKWAYPEVMRSSDILRAVIESGLHEHRERRENSIRAFLRAQYEVDEEVRFKQVELQNKLLELFIDVPLSFRDPQAEKRQYFVFQKIFESRRSGSDIEMEDLDVTSGPIIAENGVRWHQSGEDQIGAATLLLSRAMQVGMPRIVLEGAPGQGKSTISQYICQVHRMRLLQEDAVDQIDKDHALSPLRLPIKVDLRDLATWLTKRDPFNAGGGLPGNWFKSLESFLAALISHHSGGTQFSVDDLLAVLKISSILLVFDGLDEVADLARRKEVVDELARGIQRLEENAAALQVVITSRPAVFANSPGMPHRKFPHLQLVSLNKPLILRYADRWLRARRLDSTQSSEFRSILKEKLDQPHLRDLARNPMQLAILLSLIHTRGASLPDKRTALYDYYIDLFFNREAAKSPVVRDHRELLIDIHRYLAWLLHAEAEEEGSRASISQERLLQIVSDYLKREGHPVDLAEELFNGMVERVVALVSRVEGTFEFEVQPLREYFAACHLYYTAPHSSPGKEQTGSKPDRFDAISRNFFWLNVTRFYSGCYSKGELASLADRIEELSQSAGFSMIDYPRILGTTLLGDWVFSQVPKLVARVLQLTLNGNGLRYLLATQHPRTARTSSGVLSLPPRCGRDELVFHALNLLNSELPPDVTHQLVMLIKANIDEDKSFTGKWIDLVEGKSGMDRLRWLEIGTDLGAVSNLPTEQLQRLFEPFLVNMNTRALGILFRAGKTDVIEASETLFDATVEGILDRTIAAQPQRRIESPLQALSHAVDLFRYAIAFRDRQPRPLFELAEARHRVAKLTWPEEITTLSEPYKNHRSCVELARVAEKESQRPSIEWATEVEPWSLIVEKGRDLWGNRWCFTTLANLGAGVRSVAETCTDAQDLMNDAHPLTRRLRYARLRSGSSKWWQKQLERASSEHQIELWLLAALSWMSSSSILAFSSEIGQTLDTLGIEAWTRMANSVRRNFFLTRPDTRKPDAIDARNISRQLTTRTACILMDRATPASQAQIYGKYLKGTSLDDEIVRRFAVAEALDEENFAMPEWNPNLGIIRECYKRGDYVEASLRYWRRGDQQHMAADLAETICSDATSYPLVIVNAAQDRLRNDVRASVVPVAQTALSESWF